MLSFPPKQVAEIKPVLVNDNNNKKCMAYSSAKAKGFVTGAYNKSDADMMHRI